MSCSACGRPDCEGTHDVLSPGGLILPPGVDAPGIEFVSDICVSCGATVRTGVRLPVPQGAAPAVACSACAIRAGMEGARIEFVNPGYREGDAYTYRVANPPGSVDLALIREDYVYAAEALAFLAALPDCFVDAMITDGPYSSGGYVRGDRAKPVLSKYVDDESPWQGTRGFMGDNRDQRSWCYWMALWLSEAHRVVKPGGYAGVFTDWRQLPSATDSLQAGGFLWRGVVVWDKGPSARAPHTGYFRHQAEYFVWGTKGHLEPAKHGGPFPGVIPCPVLHADKRHVTYKPVPLMRELVRCVPPGGLILDPFAGSGSTLVASLLEGRRGIACEVDPETAKEANSWLDATRAGLDPRAADAGQKPLFESEA